MSEIAERYRTVAAGMTRAAMAVPADAWDKPAPCDGWVARDVVRHMVEWIPAFLRSGADVDLPEGPSVDDDPVAAWRALDDGIQGVLEDPTDCGQRSSTILAPAGTPWRTRSRPSSSETC